MKRILIPAILFIAGQHAVTAQRPDTSFNATLKLVKNLYQTLSDHYVEPVNKDSVALNTLNGMMRKLDPWTYFMDKSTANAKKEMMTNRFAGVGLTMKQLDNDIVITNVYSGYPADKGGLRSADILVSANGKSLKGLTTADASELLRGEPGSKVTVVYKRQGMSTNLSSVLTRDVIQVTSVPYYGMLTEHIGYIYISGMTTASARDVHYAYLELKKNPQLQGLILDLRDNWGGYLQSACDIASLFLPKGTSVVKVIGRTTNTHHVTRYDPFDLTIPLAVLIGNNTASSAEILSGVLQDYDRAVFIGDRTYGKAMVQDEFDLGDGNIANLTIAHYYTPSGRCIQVRGYKDSYGKIIEDSLHKVFKTKNGRPVKSHNAISPDIEMKYRLTPIIALAANKKNLFHKYAMSYRATHTQIPEPAVFRLTDAEFNEFYNSIIPEATTSITLTDLLLDEWKTEAIRDQQWKEAEPAYLLLKEKLADAKRKELEADKLIVKRLLERQICQFYYGERGYIESFIKDDAIVKKAKEILGDRNLYKSILNITN